MITVRFYPVTEIADASLQFAVIVARQDGEWIFCRHQERSSWEIPGGHREEGEPILETAQRELYEETGALEYTLREVCVYGVDRDGAISYGLLCFAEIKTRGALPPETEIGLTARFQALPKTLTWPAIQPYLFDHIQGWLNLQSSPDELWDLYDENRNPLPRTHRRGDPLPAGTYHLVVHVWLQNSNGEYLLTQRAPDKGFPNLWACTGGSALAGDTSLDAALREVKEETGLSAAPENGQCLLQFRRRDSFLDVWLFRQNFSLRDVRLQSGETCGAMSAAKDTILKMGKEGLLVPFPYLSAFFEIAGKQLAQ